MAVTVVPPGRSVEPDSASDRVALAEIYAVDDPPRAIGELRKVLERDIHHAPAYCLLASFYNRTGDTERATRVLTALDLLGFAEEKASLEVRQKIGRVKPHAARDVGAHHVGGHAPGQRNAGHRLRHRTSTVKGTIRQESAHVERDPLQFFLRAFG